MADDTVGLERDARRIAAEAREKGNARLELQALATSRAHVELMAKLATASQTLEPAERLARERQAEAARLAAATLGAVQELVDRGDLHPKVAQALREAVAGRLGYEEHPSNTGEQLSSSTRPREDSSTTSSTSTTATERP